VLEVDAARGEVTAAGSNKAPFASAPSHLRNIAKIFHDELTTQGVDVDKVNPFRTWSLPPRLTSRPWSLPHVSRLAREIFPKKVRRMSTSMVEWMGRGGSRVPRG
jgi:hypothetical protein